MQNFCFKNIVIIIRSPHSSSYKTISDTKKAVKIIHINKIVILQYSVIIKISDKNSNL